MQIATNRLCIPFARLHHWCGLLSTVVVLSLAIIPPFQKCSASELKMDVRGPRLRPQLSFACGVELKPR